MPKGGSFPLPVKYIDAVRRTHTTLDVLLESLIDDRGNVDGDRDLSGPWSGCTRFMRLKKKSLKGYMWSRERLTRVQATFRPDYLMARSVVSYVEKFPTQEKTASGFSKAKPRQCSSTEGVCHIDPDDLEFENTLKCARRKLKAPRCLANRLVSRTRKRPAVIAPTTRIRGTFLS